MNLRDLKQEIGKKAIEEYKEDKRKREEQSQQMLEMLKNAFYNSKNHENKLK